VTAELPFSGPDVEVDDTGGTETGIDVRQLAALANDLFRSVPGHDFEEPLPTGRAALGRIDSPIGLTPPPHTLAPQSLLDLPNPPMATPVISEVDQHTWAAPTDLHQPSVATANVPGQASPGSTGILDPGLASTGLPRGSIPSTPATPATPSMAGPAAPPADSYYFLTEATSARGTPGAAEAASVAEMPAIEGQLHDPQVRSPDRRRVAPPPTEQPGRYYLPDHGPVSGTSVPDERRIFDVATIRRDFPILSERINGRQITWLDNAATTQKPRSVIDRLSYFYEHENSNIHRAAHDLAARATDAYEKARSTVARFIGADSPEDIVFVRGTTEGINLISHSWGQQNIHEGDEIIISHLEHHANIVPWQQLVARTGAMLKVIPVDDDGQLLLHEYQRLLSDRTKLVAVAHVSNALGTVTPMAEVIAMAHRVGACALVDGAQSISHMSVDVQALDADFFVFSGHKIYGPTGIGVVYAKKSILDGMPPWQTGGNMITDVTLERSLFQEAPTKFEAGTGNIADAVGLDAALEYVERLGIENIRRYEHELLGYGTRSLLQVPGLRLIGTAPDKASVLSFILDGYTPAQVGEALSDEGIAVRSGNHCAQPILRRFGLEATVRPSLSFYNTTDEIDHLASVLHRLAASSGSRLR
jgi:cysteine desulfurase / selenocysteine lyase